MSKPIPLSILKSVLTNKNLPALFGGEATHEPAVSLAASMVHAGADDDLIADVVAAALPEGYAGDTLTELPAMIASARRKGFEDTRPSTSSRGSRKRRMSAATEAYHLIAHEFELFHDPEGKGFMTVPTSMGGRLCHPIRSRRAELLLRGRYFEASGRKALSRHAMTDLIDTLESEAINSPQERPVFRRVARIEQVIYIDLGTPEGEVVEIDEKGWQVRTDTPVAFLRDGGFRPLPAPVPGGDIADLKSILQLGDENWVLVLGFLLNCLRGEGPFMCLIVEGQQGSGKSFLCEVIKRLIDPNAAARLNLSQDTREVMLQARSFYLPVYDNASGMKGDVADTLCTIATGGAIVKRSLYTDAELCSISAQRPFIMNGIGDYATRADLLERAIPIELPALATRLTEAALLSRLETKAPEILGALYDAVSQGLRNIDRVVLPTGPSPRMIDAARWITAAEPAGASGTFVKRLNTKQADVAVERITNEPLYAALDNTITYPFHGSMSELLRKLNPGEKFQHSLPQTPAALSKLVKRLAPQLGYAGIHVRFEERTNNCRPVTIWKDGQTPPAPRFSTPRTQRLSSLIGGLTRTRLDA